MSEYRPTEYVVDFGDCRSNRFVVLNMTLIKQNGAKLSERIVRCRDCKHAWETEGGALRCLGYLVDKWDYYNDEPSDGKDVYEEDFCAWGERRDA